MAQENDNGYDIRTILSQMREEYWQALAEEESEAKEMLECLVFTLGGERYAFETHFACEVIRIPKLVRVPAVQGLVKGIFNLRGEITAAIDVRPMLGLPQPELGPGGRIVVVRGENFATGIMVEETSGVSGFSFDCFEPAAGLSGLKGHFVRGHFNLENAAVILLDMEALLAAPELLVGEA